MCLPERGGTGRGGKKGDKKTQPEMIGIKALRWRYEEEEEKEEEEV